MGLLLQLVALYVYSDWPFAVCDYDYGPHSWAALLSCWVHPEFDFVIVDSGCAPAFWFVPPPG